MLLGGGSDYVQQLVDGESVEDAARQAGFVVVDRDTNLDSLVTDKPILGTFDGGTLEVRWRGAGGRIAEPTETSWINALSDYLGEATEPEPMVCEPNPDYGNTPSLASMSGAALRHLSRENDIGFFLMIESASIDKQSHKRNPCGDGEFNEETLSLAMAFAETHPDTAIIVTADHAQAAQILPRHASRPDPDLLSGIDRKSAHPGGRYDED